MSKLIVTCFLVLGVSLVHGNSLLLELPAQENYLTSWGDDFPGVQELASLISMAVHPDVQRLAKVFKDNHHFIDKCNLNSEPQLQGIPSCFNVTADIANVTLLIFNGYELFEKFTDSLVVLLNELNKCPSESIWNQYGCYKQAFKDIQFDISEYTSDINGFLYNSTLVFKSFAVDIKNCFSSSKIYSPEWVESKIELCKLDLQVQNL